MSDVRSGSTLLENILSNSPEIVSVGELIHLHAYLNKGDVGKVFEWKCSCGKDFNTCEFWSKIFSSLKEHGIIDVKKTSVFKSKDLNFRKRLESIHLPENEQIINHVDKIYETIFDISNKSFIVDSSKNEIQLAALIKYSRYNIKVIYIKRDIRAVVLSKLKWQIKLGLKQTNIFKLLLATKIKNNIQNTTFGKVVKKNDRLKLNYGEIANDVPGTLNKIFKFTGIEPYTSPKFMEMHNNHSVGGTPNRERREISYDNSWKAEIATKPFFRMVGKFIDFI
ncbi:MAG: sulfotransferase [Moheibacter sp.]